MGWLTLALAVGTVPAFAEVEVEGVRIRVHVRASEYTYELTNTGRDPITRFEFAFTSGYNFTPPDGWESDQDGDVFRAWAQRKGDAIHPGHTVRFSLRVSSRGGVLGHVPARVETLSGKSVTLRNVWGAVPEPRGHVLLVAGVAGAIFVLHSLLLARSDCRSDRRATPP